MIVVSFEHNVKTAHFERHKTENEMLLPTQRDNLKPYKWRIYAVWGDKNRKVSFFCHYFKDKSRCYKTAGFLCLAVSFMQALAPPNLRTLSLSFSVPLHTH